MAVNYKKGGTDLDSLCEKYVYSSAGMTNYKLSGSSIASRYQKANTNSWANKVNTGYKVGGTEVVTCAIGCFPTPTMFASLTSGSNLSISRSSSGITIGSTTYGTSTFRDGVIPKYIGVVLVGGGGGGGGTGMDKGNKSGYNVDPGGSGGGAGVASFVLNLNYSYTITIGSGGAGGSNGSSSSRPSAGTNGSDGGNTSIYLNGTQLAYGMGGGGGIRGLEGASDTGNGGSGRHAYFVNSYSSYLLDTKDTQGSYGNNTRSQTSSAVSMSRVFADAGQSATTFFSNPATDRSYSSGDSYRHSYANGGSSYGVGGHRSPTSTSTSPGYGGGGGSNGYGSQSGGGGAAFFYY